MILHPQNFSPYDPNQVGGGALTQAKPAVFVFPWIPNTPAGVGTQRQQPHERGTWFTHPIIPRNAPFFWDHGQPPAGSGLAITRLGTEPSALRWRVNRAR